MYVCICNAINETAIEDAIERGATSAREVYFALGVKPKCGKCKPEIQDMINDAMRARAEAQPSDNPAYKIAAE